MSLSVRVCFYVLEGDTAGATGGCSPIHLDVGASAGSAFCYCRGAVGHELGVLLINYLQSMHTHISVSDKVLRLEAPPQISTYYFICRVLEHFILAPGAIISSHTFQHNCVINFTFSGSIKRLTQQKNIKNPRAKQLLEIIIEMRTGLRHLYAAIC